MSEYVKGYLHRRMRLVVTLPTHLLDQSFRISDERLLNHLRELDLFQKQIDHTVFMGFTRLYDACYGEIEQNIHPVQGMVHDAFCMQCVCQVGSMWMRMALNTIVMGVVHAITTQKVKPSLSVQVGSVLVEVPPSNLPSTSFSYRAMSNTFESKLLKTVIKKGTLLRLKICQVSHTYDITLRKMRTVYKGTLKQNGLRVIDE